MVSWARTRVNCSMQPQDILPSVPAAPAPAEAKRSQGTARAIASEGTSPKRWQIPHGLGPVGVKKTRVELQEHLPRFQRMYGNAWMSGRSLLQGQSPKGQPLLGQC